jgi:hypothetical protein
MPFDPPTKAQMFISCARLCSLCFKQCGINIEAAHIIDEAKVGSNDADNGIPLCFDCHQEIGSYRDDHPRGNKFRPEELKARRDHIYHLVNTGAIQAQLITQRSRSISDPGVLPPLTEEQQPTKLSSDAEQFLRLLQSDRYALNATARKLNLFSSQDRAQILDGLLTQMNEHTEVLLALAQIIQDKTFPRQQTGVIADKMVRATTLYGSIDQKAALLNNLSDDVLGTVYEDIRLALFEDLIAITNRDQFDDVNKIVPAMVTHANVVPEVLFRDYVSALLKQGASDSYRGAPAAKRAALALPEPIAKAFFHPIDREFIFWNSRHEHFRQFISLYKHLANPSDRALLDDLTNMPEREFHKKHYYDFFDN